MDVSSDGSSSQPIDFSLDGAQSINLQNFLQSNDTFVCVPCNRTFASHKGLQIHRSYHNKLSSKINSRKFERKRKENKEDSCYFDDSDQCHVPISDLDEFLNICNSSSKDYELKENLAGNENINNPQSNLICSVCQFVAKTSAGLSIHTKRHVSAVSTDNAETIIPSAANIIEEHIPKVRIPCPFSPSLSTGSVCNHISIRNTVTSF